MVCDTRASEGGSKFLILTPNQFEWLDFFYQTDVQQGVGILEI
jgi:hypothetical protein